MEKVDVKLTKEYKDKLKGFLAFRVDSEFKYVPKIYRVQDIPKGLWPVFTLRSLDAFELAEMEDKAGEWLKEITEKKVATKFQPRTGETRITTLKKGIMSWKNLRDEDNNVIEFKDESSIAQLPSPLQIELQDTINERNTLTQEELQGLES